METNLATLTTIALRTPPDRDKQLQVPQPQEITFDISGLVVPKHEAKRTGDTIKVEFDVSEIREGAGSSIVQEPQTSIMVAASNNFIHDFTFSHLEKHTDRKFSDVFPPEQDDFDTHTPDVILDQLGDRIAVIEFATSRRSDFRYLRKVFDRKIGKYEVPCLNRAKAGKTIVLFCIVASEDKIVTNMDLSEVDAAEICLRFNTAVDVYSFMHREKLVPELLEGETTSMGTQVQILFQDIKFDWPTTEAKFHPFSATMYAKWQEGYDDLYVAKVLAFCQKQTNDMLKADHLLESGLTRAEKLAINYQVTCDAIDVYVKDFVRPGKMRHYSDQKCTIPIPSIVPKLCPNPTVDLDSALRKEDFFPDTQDPVGGLWRQTFLALLRDEIPRAKELQETEERFMLGDASLDEEHTAKALRSRFHRVYLSVSSEDAIELAKLGIEGKRHRHEPAVKLNREEKKKGFPLATDVSNIDTFLNEHRSMLFAGSQHELPDYIESILKANRAALDAHGFSGVDIPTVNQIEDFWGSPIMQWALMVSTIGVELAIANKQHSNQGEFVVKKLRHYDVYLLIKLTNSKGPMFVSLAWNTSDIPCRLSATGVFKRFTEQGGWAWTAFHSFKQSKITTLVKTASRVHNLYWYWREHFNLQPWRDCDGEAGMTDVCRMFKLSLMTMLEDKARTEELLTLFRYTMLEGFVSEPCLPKPGKMIEKLPNIARTHLQVWLIKKSLATIRRVAQQPWQAEVIKDKIVWKDIENPFTGGKVEDSTRLVSLFYIGYLKNKDEPAEKNAMPALIRKIVKMEEKHPGRYDYLGLGDPHLTDIRTHEYSLSFQKYICEAAMEILKATWGQNVKDTIHLDILDSFSNLTLDKVSTLKASSAFDETWYTTDGTKKYHRKKVIENFQKFVTPENTHVIHVLKQCLETVEQRGCMHIDIFKKNQHGGLREIYVLGPEERVVQLGLETIARAVCSKFKSETLTNPDQKTRVPETHGKRARAAQPKGNLTTPLETVGTSDDLKTFNQTQHTTKLALTLIKFTREELHPFIIRGCSLFMKKRIKLDDDLLQIIINNTELKTDDPTLATLHAAFRGELDPPPRWAKEGLSFIETETGMLQGILHFLSSLHHTCLQEWFKYYATFQLSTIFKRKNCGVLVDVLQSSDDSAVLITYPIPEPQVATKCRVVAAQLLHIKKYLGEFLALYPSVKCTTNTLHFLEFNSEFFFHNDHVRPTLKWVIAADQISEQEAIVSRQEEMASSLTGVLEGGGSISLCHMLQYGQSLLHYTLLGANTSFLFRRFMEEANLFKDPSLGFFLMDHVFGAGLAGFKYNLWNMVRDNNLGAIYKLFLQQVREEQVPEVKERVYKSLETTSCGALASTVTIRHGNRKNWEAMVERCDVPDDWESQMDENPEMCYRQPKTTKEVKLKLAEKLHAPGVSASLSRGDQVIKIISSSIYILSRNVICEGTSWMCPEEAGTTKKKPLLRLILERNKIKLDDTIQLTEEEIQTLFPMNEEYRHVKSMLADHMSVSGSKKLGRRTTVQTKVVVIQREEVPKAKPEDILVDVWFKLKRSGLTKAVLRHSFEEMQRSIPWLRDTAEESLKHSPFLHQHQMHNFISRMDYQGRVVKLVGAPLKAKTETNLATVITRNFFPMWELDMSYDARAWEDVRLSSGLKHFCLLLTAGPYTQERKEHLFHMVLREYPQLKITPGAGKSRTNTLALLQKYLTTPKDQASSLNAEMRNANCGVVGGFTKPQLSYRVPGRVEYIGPGVWEGTVNGHFVEIHIDSDGARSYLRKVYVASEEFARTQLCPFIRQWCKEMNVHNMRKFPKEQAFTVLFKYLLYTYGEGCPVFLRTQSVPGPDIPIDKLSLSIEGNCISLIHSLGEGRRAKILSYNCRSTDASEEAAASLMEHIYHMPWVKKEPSESWMRLMSLHQGTLEVHMRAMKAGSEMPGIDRDRYREILQDSTRTCLALKGYTLHDIPPCPIGVTGTAAAMSLMWNPDITSRITSVVDEAVRSLFNPILDETPEDPEDPGPSRVGIVSIPEQVQDETPMEVDGEESGPKVPLIFGIDFKKVEISDFVDVCAFGEPEFEAGPGVKFRHSRLTEATLKTLIDNNFSASDLTSLLEMKMVLKRALEPAKTIMWLLRREEEVLTVIERREDWTEDIPMGEAMEDESMIG
nr:MAG: RNA-dependent RNA polymerase [Brown dog tick phlebovirus 1]